MVKQYNYRPYDIEIGFSLEEGDITVDDDTELVSGTGTSWTLEDKIKKGDFVTLDTTQDMTVKKAGAADEVIGEIIDTPRWKGKRPMVSSESGTYTKRIATVRLYGHYVREVTLPNANTAITVGDSVEHKGDNKFGKASTANNTRALSKAEALAKGTVPVLFGYYGI